MFHIVYQCNWAFNLKTLLMLRIFGKWPPSWKTLSTIYQYNKWVDLISDCNNLNLNFLKSQLQCSCKWCAFEKKIGSKRGVF
jgi:hypothetical protein